MTMTQLCPLCQTLSVNTSVDAMIVSTTQYRVVWADEVSYPCFVRVVWGTHVPEMTGLSAPERSTIMDAVFAVEAAMRAVLAPDKINLASFGNWVPHLHWHVIPRFKTDAHWPNSTFSAPNQTGTAHGESLKTTLAAAIVQNIKTLGH